MVKTQAEKILSKLRRVETNKRCADCAVESTFGFNHICVKYDIFVCHKCKSAHQAYSHRVKDILMSTFTLEEVQRIKTSGGNERNREKYYGKLSDAQLRKKIPGKTASMGEIKDWIVEVYENKTYFNGSGSGKTKKKKKKKKKKKTTKSSPVDTIPVNEMDDSWNAFGDDNDDDNDDVDLFGNDGKIEGDGTFGANQDDGEDLDLFASLSMNEDNAMMTSAAAAKVTKKKKKKKKSVDVVEDDFDLFGAEEEAEDLMSGPSSVSANGGAHVGGNGMYDLNSLYGNAIGSSITSAVTRSSAQQKDDPFSGLLTASAATTKAPVNRGAPAMTTMTSSSLLDAFSVSSAMATPPTMTTRRAPRTFVPPPPKSSTVGRRMMLQKQTKAKVPPTSSSTSTGPPSSSSLPRQQNYNNVPSGVIRVGGMASGGMRPRYPSGNGFGGRSGLDALDPFA